LRIITSIDYLRLSSYEFASGLIAVGNSQCLPVASLKGMAFHLLPRIMSRE
jgi:hypothetical protein